VQQTQVPDHRLDHVDHPAPDRTNLYARRLRDSGWLLDGCLLGRRARGPRRRGNVGGAAEL